MDVNLRSLLPAAFFTINRSLPGAGGLGSCDDEMG